MDLDQSKLVGPLVDEGGLFEAKSVSEVDSGRDRATAWRRGVYSKQSTERNKVTVDQCLFLPARHLVTS